MAISPSAWHVAKSRVRGLRHERCDLDCEDACHAQVRNELFVAAVADGAGSAAHSATGARRACEAAVAEAQERLLETRLSAEQVRKVFEAAFERSILALESTAHEQDLCIRDLATTLVIAVATPDFVAGYQIGDGAVVMERGEEGLEALTKPDVGEYANQTYFLDRSTLERAQYAYREGPCRHVALITDGLQGVALEHPGWRPFAGFFEPILHTARAEPSRIEDRLNELFVSHRMRARTDDDLTMVIATRLAPTDARQDLD